MLLEGPGNRTPREMTVEHRTRLMRDFAILQGELALLGIRRRGDQFVQVYERDVYSVFAIFGGEK